VIDALGRPLTITITDDDAGIMEVTRHQYDKGGLLKEVRRSMRRISITMRKDNGRRSDIAMVRRRATPMIRRRTA